MIVLALLHLTMRDQATAPNSSNQIGLKAGEIAPDFEIAGIHGPITKDQFHGQTFALLFVSPSCPSCTATLYELDGLEAKTGGPIVVVCRAPAAECEELRSRHNAVTYFVSDEADGLSKRYGIDVNPTAVIIDANGRIDTYGNPMRAQDLEDMIDQDATVAATIV